MRAWDVKEAEEEEAPAEPSPLPAADVKEPVALAPEQVLKPAQRMCKFLALRLAVGNPSASDMHKAALSGSELQLLCKTVSFEIKMSHLLPRSAPWLARAVHILVSQRRKRCHLVPQRRWVEKERPAINPADRQAGAQLPYTRKLPRQLIILV